MLNGSMLSFVRRSLALKLLTAPVRPVCINFFSTSSSHWSKNYDHALPISEIPGPVKAPLIGNLYQVNKAGGIENFNVALQVMRKEYGDIFKLKLGKEKMVCVADPDMIEDAFRKEGKYPRRERPFPAWVNYHKKNNLPVGVFLAEDEEWYRQRNAMNPKLLNIKQVEQYAGDFNQVIDQLMQKIMSLRDKNMEIEGIEKQLFKWSFESVCTVLFETHIGCFSSRIDPRYEEFIEAVHVIFDVMTELLFQIPLIDKVVDTKANKDFRKNMDIIYKLTEEEIDDKLKKYKAGGAGQVDENTAKQFIPYLYYVQEMMMGDIKSNIMSLMVGAIDATSATMQFLLFNLANNQNVQNKLHEEISYYLKPDEPATPAVLKKMPYIKAVIKESQRLSSVLPFNARWFTEDMCIAGYKIPANTLILLLHNEVCQNKVYFDEPDKFLPERWMRDNKEAKEIHPFASLPFGHGPRGCLGRRLAELEMQLLLARIFGKYVVECDKKTVTLASAFLKKPAEDIKFKIYER